MRRLFRRLITPLLLAALFFIWLFPEKLGLNMWQGESVSGAHVIVRDGDTLTIGTQDIRLSGIDAPEFTQSCKKADGADWPCGRQARTEMLTLVGGHIISCAARTRDKYGRLVSTCRDEAGRDLGRTMVERGMAINYGGFGEGPYGEEEASAKAAKRGIWAGSFEPPSRYRGEHPHGHMPHNGIEPTA